MQNEATVTYLRYYPDISLEGLRKITKNLTPYPKAHKVSASFNIRRLNDHKNTVERCVKMWTAREVSQSSTTAALCGMSVAVRRMRGRERRVYQVTAAF
jgi:hypothetical protein